MRKACEDSHQSNLANVQNLVSELNVQPMETPLHATQEALSMLEAYLNIYSTRRQRKFNSNDLKTKEPNVFPKSSCVIPDEKFAVKKEPLQTDQRRVHKTSVNDDEKLNTAMVAKECFDVQKRCQNQSLHSNTNSMNSGDACLLRNEKPEVGCPHIQLTKGSLPQATKNSDLNPSLDTVDDLGSCPLQPGSLYALSSTETASSPISQVSSRTLHTRAGISLLPEKTSVKGDLTSPTIRHHSISDDSEQRSHFMPKVEEWSELELNCHRTQYTRRCSVRSAPEDMHHCVRMKSKRSAPRKWFKFCLPKSSYAFKSQLVSKVVSDQAETSDSKNSSKYSNRQAETPPMTEKRANAHDGDDNKNCFSSNTCNSKSDIHIQTNKPDDNFHHPPIINMFAQLFPRLFRQDGSSSSCVSNGFFLRMQRLSATTARRVKRKKRHNRKFNRLTSQVSVEEHEEKFSLLPLYTKRRLSGLTHQEKDKSLEKEGEVTIGAVVTNVSNRSSNAELWKNDLFSTPTVNSQTWPTDSPNSKMANEVARLYQGLIETIESDKLIKSRYHTWSYCSGGKAHHPNRDYLPSFGRNSVIQLRKTSKACQCSTLKNLTASGDSTDHSEVTDKTPLYNGKASGEVENVTDSPQSYHEKNSSVKSRLFPNEAAKDSENSPTENPKLENKTEETDHYTRSSANGYAKYPYVKYVAAMIDALSERLMGKISEDDLELRFQTLEAEASEAAKHNIQSNKRERFLSVSNEAEILQYHNSVQNTHRNSSPEENVNNRVKNKKLGNKRCRSISCFRVTSRQSDSDDSSPLESSPHSLKHCCLAQVKRLQLRNKLVITTNLLNRLGNHTNYPSFEADVLKLLGRQPSWHRIAILYYLTRCVVRHIISNHFQKLESIKGSVSSSGSSVLHQSLVVNSDSDETDDHHLYVAGSHHILRGSSELSQCSLDPLNPLYDTVVTETCRCRANVGRMKEYTITFFTRWYADWVYQRGGWQSVIDETEDSEID